MSEETAAPATPETPESAAPPVEAAAETPKETEPAEPDFSIDDLMAAEIDDPILTSNENFKGVKYQEVLNELPDEAKKIVANLRSSFSKKTQELAEQRKMLESQSKEIEAQREALLSSDFYKNLTDKAATDVGTLDPYDNTSFEKRIEHEVASRMKDMLEPMRAQHELQQREYKLGQFKEEHPDMVDLKQDIAGVLVKNKHMSLEQAYWQVKGQKLVLEESERRVELDQYKTAARNAGLKIGGKSRNGGSSIPKSVLEQDDPIAVYKWLQNNK